jgi:thioredoxin
MKLPKNAVLYLLIGIFAVFIGGRYFIAGSSKQLYESSALKKVADEKEFKAIVDKAGSKLIVVDLYATWCGVCRMVQPTLNALAEKYAGTVEFYRVNVDESPQLARTFETRAIPYVIFMKNGKIVATFAGAKTAATYEKVIAEWSASAIFIHPAFSWRISHERTRFQQGPPSPARQGAARDA